MEPDDVPLPPLPEDEAPHAEECQKLFRSLPKGLLNALFLFARYKNSYGTYKSVRKYFDRFVSMGFANPNDRTPTGKGKLMHRIMCCASVEEINQQVEANEQRNREREEAIKTNNRRVLITPPPDPSPTRSLITAIVLQYNIVVPALEAQEKTTGIQSAEYGALYRQKLALEEVLGAYHYMLDWCPITKQFTVYLDK